MNNNNGGRIVNLVSYDVDFLNLSWKWLNDEEIKKMTMAPDFSREEQKIFFDSLVERSDYFIYGIICDGQKIGACGLKNLLNNSAEYWGYIGEKEYWGRGVGGRGVGGRVMEIIIKKSLYLNIESLFLKVLTGNERAIRLYKKFGFCIREETDKYFIMDKKL